MGHVVLMGWKPERDYSPGKPNISKEQSRVRMCGPSLSGIG